jgi:transcriptional regulator with XRE-family HTH domain
MNLVGPQVRRLRVQQRLSQPQLAARCQVVGYELSRESLAKIESRLRGVTDAEVVCLAQALRVPFAILYPSEKELIEALKPFLGKPRRRPGGES